MPTPTQSPHPTLDRFKAQLAGMTPPERQKMFLLLAQLVKQQLQAQGDSR